MPDTVKGSAIPSEELPELSAALERFDAAPRDPEIALNLSRSFRYREMHDAALLFSIMGMSLIARNDPLYHIMKAEVSTSGFYSKNPEMREAGHAACEELVLSRNCHPAARHVAFQNLFHYTKRLSDYAPSFHAERIQLDPPDGYYPMNPSICRLGNQMFINVRCVNYYTDFDERVVLPTDEPLRTRNILMSVSPDLIHAVISEVLPPPDLPRLNTKQPLGVEDVRLFPWHDDLWFSGTVVQANTEEMAEIMIGWIPATMEMCRWHIFRDIWPEPRHEKNWSPICEASSVVEPPLFIYSHDPCRHVSRKTPVTHSWKPPIAAHTWSGSTQAIPFNVDLSGKSDRLDEPGLGYLVMIHEKMYYAEMRITRRWYQQRFVWYDRDWNLKKISRRFQFGNGETEFPCGMCWHPDGDRLVISYGVLDREAWIATVHRNEVEDMLYDVGEA